MMTIELYQNTADPRRVDKTSYLSLVQSVDGTLREESSVVNPIIMIETISNTQGIVTEFGDPVDANGNPISYDYQIGTELPAYNYAYIEEFHRYYFVTEIVSVRYGLWRLVLKCDTLMSFKDDFVKYGVMAFVTRNEYDFNPKIDDPLMSWTEETSTYIKALNSWGTRSNFKFDSGIALENKRHFTCVNFVSPGKRDDILGDPAPSDDIFGTIEPWTGATSEGMDDFDLPVYASDQNTLVSNTIPYVMDQYRVNMFQHMVTLDDTKLSGVLGVVSWPFEIPSEWIGAKQYTASNDTWVYGNTQDSQKDYVLNYSGSFPYLILTETRLPTLDTYRTMPPHAQYDIFIPYYGWVDIDILSLAGHKIMIYYSLSIFDGSGEVFLLDEDTNTIVFTGQVQVGTKLNLSTTNFLENSTQQTQLALNMIMSIVGGGFMIATGHPVSGIAVATGGVANSAIKSMGIFDRAQVTITKPQTGNMSTQIAYLRIRTKKPAVEAMSMDDFAKLKGRPLMASRSLVDLMGFTMVEDIRFPTTATKLESDEIRALLKTGVYL